MPDEKHFQPVQIPAAALARAPFCWFCSAMPISKVLAAIQLFLAGVVGLQAAVTAPVQQPSRTNAASPSRASATAATSTNRHTLWRVKGTQNVVYLLGSVHLLKDSDYPLAPVIENAFSNSSTVAFETDIEALESPAIALKLVEKGRLPEGKSLKTELTPATYKMWSDHISKSGLPAELFDQFTPGMAGLTLSMLEITQLGLDPNKGIDKHFYRKAKEAGKTIVPLETVDFQISMATDFSKEEGELLMKTTLKELGSLKTDLGDILTAWRTGNGNQLEKLLNSASKDSPAVYKRMVSDRNRSWMPKIQAFAKGKGNAIVIVGAAHLVGKEGVVNLLRQLKYPVDQL